MDPGLEELLGTLLYEGYALYPYTPGATKNATPTPFGCERPLKTRSKAALKAMLWSNSGAML